MALIARPGLSREEVRVTRVTYCGDHASCTNGPLWTVRGVVIKTGQRVLWFASTDPRKEPSCGSETSTAP